MRRHEIHIGTHIEGKKLEERRYGITAGKKKKIFIVTFQMKLKRNCVQQKTIITRNLFFLFISN